MINRKTKINHVVRVTTVIKIIAIASIFVIIFVLATSQVFSFDNKKTHRDLASLSVELYNSKNPNNKISGQELEWIRDGAKDEDDPFTRCLNHFYNPATGKPIFPTSNTAIEWAHDSKAQSVPSAGGDFTWERAKYAFADNDNKRAFESLGHILHLVEDMAVPAHTRSDPHGGGDPFEEWTRDNGKDITTDKIANCFSLDNCMQKLANILIKCNVFL